MLGGACEIICGCFLQSTEPNFGTQVVLWTKCEQHFRKTLTSDEPQRTLALLFTALTNYTQEVNSARAAQAPLWIPAPLRTPEDSLDGLSAVRFDDEHERY